MNKARIYIHTTLRLRIAQKARTYIHTTLRLCITFLCLLVSPLRPSLIIIETI